MAKTSLSPLTKSPILVPECDASWPISDQFMGLEIEIENYSANEVRALLRSSPAFWEQKEDGSLRNGTELVLNQPLMGRQLTDAIRQFSNTVRTYTTGPRTSIHVHMNMRQDTDSLESLRNIVTLYFMYENAFFAIADDNRKWCSYCNHFEDQPPAPLIEILRDGSLRQVTDIIHQTNANHNRYYGLNLYALSAYGTLEFRHFPCVKDMGMLENWLRLLMELKLAANRMADEDQSPFEIFSDPRHLPRLQEYMPSFGGELRRLVPDEEAYRRLALAAMYRAGDTSRDEGYVSRQNPVFARFLNEKKVPENKGNVKTSKKSASGILSPQEIEVAHTLVERDGLTTNDAIEVVTRNRAMREMRQQQEEFTAAEPAAQKSHGCAGRT